MKKVLVTILLIIEIFMVNLTYQSFLHKEITKEESKVDRKQFAMYIKENDEYVEYKEDNLFPKNYYVNKSLSKCVDENGNPVENVINSLGNNVTITSNKTVYCTLYFDKNETLEYLRSKDTNGVLSEDIVGGMYRYQGVTSEYASDDLKVVDNNYICLGEDCTEFGKDLYRIIGINENGELKVIKKVPLPELYGWLLNAREDLKWPDSNMFHILNDSDNTFMNTLDDKLKNIIVDYTWIYGDSIHKTLDAKLMYEIETGAKEVPHYVLDESNNYVREYYTWDKNTDIVKAKIGLMYVHDYLMAYSDLGPANTDETIKSWIYFRNNVEPYEEDNRFEWLMTRYGFDSLSSGTLRVRFIYINGINDDAWSGSPHDVRPVFYLSNDIDLIGEGTLTEPFEIDYEKTGVDIINSKPANLSTEEVGGMHRYQGTKDEVNNNYLCLGDDCTEYGNDLYRILGIANDGSLKVIKKTTIGGYQWWTSSTTNIKWPDSLIFQELNTKENSFYNNFNAKYKKYILKTKWMYGDSSKSHYGINGVDIYAIETGNASTTHGLLDENGDYKTETYTWDKEKDYIESYIGMKYLHDYFLSFKEGTIKTSADAGNTWLFYKNNDQTTIAWDWFLTRYGLTGNKWYDIFDVKEVGELNTMSLGNKCTVYPVFYLSKDVVLKGKGTLKYPYVIKE